MSGDILLEMRGICKSFPGVRALDNVSLTVRRGTVHALMGDTGAGKSTLMKCLFGIYGKDAGQIILEGREVSFKSPKDALEHGVAMVHQELSQALKRSVADNLWLGRYETKFCFFTSDGEMRRRTREIFRDLELDIDPSALMETLPVGKRQMAEIAKALSYGARVIVFDEPTSSLTEEEAEHLFRIIARLRERGCGIIYISHKMEEILRISDDVTVMRDGTHVATRPAAELTLDDIIRLMVGREIKERFPKRESTAGEVLLQVRGLSGRYNSVRDVSFDLRRGEILGIAGLGGSGRTEVLELLFGLSEKASGEVLLDGSAVRIRSPRDAKRAGFALITEERRRGGIFGVLDITDNTVISSLESFKALSLFLSTARMNAESRGQVESLRVKTPSLKTKIGTLSGGNQQKVILGRWLLTSPRVLLLDEPTRGIDVGAKYEIYSIIGRLAEAGTAVIMVSGEMPELLGVTERILVMSGGRLAGELSSATATQEEIMSLASRFV